MNAPALRQVLSSALLAALAVPVSACGASIATESSKGDAAPDEGSSDAVADTIVMADTPTCTTTVNDVTCDESVTYSCGLPIPVGTSPTVEQCDVLCKPVVEATGRPHTGLGCWVTSDDTGASHTVNCATCAVGRKPADLVDERASSSGDLVADALSEIARIEAASVHAFRRLDAKLGELGAPNHLRARARSAARDEVRHARIASRLARARGAERRRVRLDKRAPTTFELALENAVEGCVKETLGVAYLAHQMEHARDPELRAMAAALHDDELAHASLSWDLVSFFDAHVDEEQRRALRAAQLRALDEVVLEAARIPSEVRDAFGLPSPRIVARLVRELKSTLYA